MNKSIQQLQEVALKKIQEAKDLNALNQLRIDYLGKKGSVQALMSQMKELPKEEKPVFGQEVNTLKQSVSKAIEQAQQILEEKQLSA